MESIELTVSLIPVFVQSHLPNTDYNRYLVLIDEHGQILKINVGILDSLEDKLQELYSDYIEFSFDWSTKQLSDARKNVNKVEISYSCRLPMVRGCTKKGTLLNFKEFFELGMDEYYGTIVSRAF